MKKYLFLLAFILPFMAMGQVTMHPTNITFDSKGRVDSVYYEKDSTVKGWIVYYKKGLVTKRWTTMCYSTLNGHYPINVSSTKQGVQQVIKEATEHYHAVMVEEPSEWFNCNGCFPKMDGNSGISSWHKVPEMRLYKIEVEGKPFDLSKYYQFIPENQVVK